MMNWILLAFSLLPVSHARFSRDHVKLVNPQPERFIQLSHARVMYADYDLIKRDFPELKSLSPEQIDRVLLDRAGVISKTQTQQDKFNTPIPTKNNTVSGLRPAAYGRAAILPFSEGQVDVKGIGLRSFAQEYGGSRYSKPREKNGLMADSDALRELVYEGAVRKILRAEGYTPGTQEIYAALDFGFNVISQNGKQEPAGAVVRRATSRDPERPAGTTPGEKSKIVESILRRYGLTSDYNNVGREWPLLTDNNVQTDLNGTVFDFGGFLAFDKMARSEVQPDPAKRLSFKRWGYDGEALPWKDHIRLWARDVAEKFRAGKITRAEIAAQIQDWLSSVRVPSPCATALHASAK